jgi:prevent-host-death family protein
MTTERTVSVSEARTGLSDILDAAERGRTTVVVRHSKPSAAIIPAGELETYHLVRRLMVELGESIAVSEDPEIVAAVHQAQDDIARGRVIWDPPAQVPLRRR